MGHFFSTFRFEPGSRLTGVWVTHSDVDPDEEMVALVSLVMFGPDQHGELEANFLGSHMPFHFGGFEGVGPDGRAWAVMMQVAPTRAAEAVGGNPFWPMSDGLDRGLHYNWQARLHEENGYTRDDLLRVYRVQGVDQGLIEDWSVPDLLQGLLAECCNVPLDQIVVGRLSQCAFPDEQHECEHDVFRDVFAMWVTGRLNPPEPELNPDDDYPDLDPDDDYYYEDIAEGLFWPEDELVVLSTKKLRKLALRGSWKKSKVKHLKRKALLALLSTPSWDNAEDAPCLVVRPD